MSPADIELVAASTGDVAKTLARWFPGLKESYYQIRRRKAPPGRWSDGAKARQIPDHRVGTHELVARAEPAGSPPGTAPRRRRPSARLTLFDHHESHAAAAAWASGFSSCAVLTIDGVGDGVSATISSFTDGRLRRVAESSARDSLGIFFEHVTNLLNMRELEDEGKVMALADYAAPVPDEDNPLLACSASATAA